MLLNYEVNGIELVEEVEEEELTVCAEYYDNLIKKEGIIYGEN